MSKKKNKKQNKKDINNATPKSTEVATNDNTTTDNNEVTKATETTDAKATESADAKATETTDAKATESADAKATETTDAKATETTDAKATESTDAKATESADAKATETTDAKATETTDDKATETTDAKATESTDDKATETTDDKATETTDDKATETTDDKATETTDDKATETTEGADDEIKIEDSSAKKSKIPKIVFAMIGVVAAFGIAIVLLNVRKYWTANEITKTYSDLLNDNSATSSVVSIVAPEEDEEEVPTGPPIPTSIQSKFESFLGVNNDFIGMVSIPNTKLSYPVVKGTDNVFYLDHTLYSEYHPFGIPFADYRSVITPSYQSSMITLYGHSSLDGTFFAAVKDYKDIEFYKENPIIHFDNLFVDAEYKIIGLFMEDVVQEDFFNFHDYVEFTSEEIFDRYMNNLEAKTYFTTTVDYLPTDQFIALQTCDYEVNNTDYRLVLVARKVRYGESSDVDTDGAIKNFDQIMPNGWVAKYGKANIHS